MRSARMTPVLVGVALGALACGVTAGHGQTLEMARQSAARYVPGLGGDLVDAACKEGPVMLYALVFRGNLEDLSRRFEARFPCLRLDKFAASGGPLAQRYMSEFQGGSYIADVWMNSSPPFADDLAAKKMLAEWIPPTAKFIPDLWKREGYWYAIGLTHIGVAWNTEEVSAEQKVWLDKLETWDRLASAPFSGSAALVDIRAGGTTQLPYYFFKTQYGALVWKALVALKPSIFNAVNPLAERLAAGEFGFAPVVTADTAIATQWLNGAPLQWRYPEPGLAVPYFIAGAAKAPHPNAAKLLLAWSLSEDGQSAWVNSTGLAPASPHAKDERRYAKEPWYKLPSKYYQADWNAIAENLKTATVEFTTGFER
jgi:iron(III) transport system substrate-binding protein